MNKTIYILDGDESKIEQGLRMLPSQSTANIIVADETSKNNLLRGTCVGQPSQNITISDFSEFLRDGSGNLKYKATSRLSITNWTYPLNDGSLQSNHFVSLDASSKSYKRGLFGAWYSTSVSKTCSGSIFIKARPFCQFGSPCTPNVVVNNEPYSDTYQASDVNFPIAGPYSYHRRYIPSLGTTAGEFGESCSDISITNSFPLGTTFQQMQ